VTKSFKSKSIDNKISNFFYSR